MLLTLYYLFACNLKNHIFIYLIVLGRSCSVRGPWDLLVLAAAHEVLFPDQGLNLGPLHWERGVLATGPPSPYLCVT